VRRGFTLLEVLVGGSLGLLALALTFGYLIPAFKAADRFRIRSQLQQSAQVVLEKVTQAASTTAPGGFSWSKSDPTAVAFNPTGTLQPANGILTWESYYQVFWWDPEEKTVHQRKWPPGEPAIRTDEESLIRAKRLTPERLLEVTSVPGPHITLAHGVVEFAVSHPGTDAALIQPVTIKLKVRESGRDDRTEAEELEQSITFRLVNQQ
jgi:type II secretory pathway pseudopilin PulG